MIGAECLFRLVEEYDFHWCECIGFDEPCDGAVGDDQCSLEWR